MTSLMGRNFNSNVQDILKQLDQLFSSPNTSGTQFYNKETLINLVDTVLFKKSKESKRNIGRTSSVHELDLANELCNYFSRQKTEYVRYCVFDLIFTMSRNTAKDYRRQILVLLISLAISMKSATVLECVALWLATTSKENALSVVSSLENDYCSIMPESVSQLRLCGTVCEKFCCMLICAFCTKYTMKNVNAEETNKEIEYPPVILLDLVQNWLLKCPSICYCIIVNMDQLWHTVLTSTRDPSSCLPLSPLAGLIQWSVKLPFAPKEFSSEIPPLYKDIIDTNYSLLQSKLHFGILSALLISSDCLSAIKQGILGNESDLQLWSKSDAHLLVGGLLAYGSDDPDPKVLTLAVERFSQISQIALTSHILNCTKEQFQSLTDPLPKNQLLDLVAYGPTRKPSVEEMQM